MAELLHRHPQYQLLLHTQRRRCPVDATTLAITCLITVPMLIFCIIYTLLFGVYDTVIYPKSYVNDVPDLWFNRAVRYNTYDIEDINNDVISDNYPRLLKSSNEAISEFKLICYYNFPSGNFQDLYAKNIDPSLCTHLNVGAVGIVNNSISINSEQLAILESVVYLKKFNDQLKVLLSVAGSGDGKGFSEMVLNHVNRRIFIKSVLHYVRNYKVDGIDLDWEFPNNQQSSDKEQVLHFTQLLEEIRMTIDRQTRHKFLLSVAVAAPTILASTSYMISYMNQYVDYINLMTYDYHFYTSLTPFTGLNSPLYPLASEKSYLSLLNINYSANYWHSMGMNKSKIMVGLPTYGHSFTLTNARNNGIYSPASGYGKLGNNGFIDYSQVCNFLFANQLSPIFETDAKSPYATKLYEWISFDDEQSLLYKAEYIRDNHFGGAMVFSLNSDDHKGLCKHGRSVVIVTFPLTKTIKKVLFNDID